MDFSKLKNKLLILLCCFVLFFPFFCITGFCSEEETLNGSVVSGIYAIANNNYFASGSGSITYYPVEKGYIYHIIPTGIYDRTSVYSSSEPAVNVSYSVLYVFPANDNTPFNYIPDNDGYLSINGDVTSFFVVTREAVPGMNSAITGLVDNVGVNSIWNIFDTSINYIVIVVLFAFGTFLIFTIIRKISKGKGDV